MISTVRIKDPFPDPLHLSRLLPTGSRLGGDRPAYFTPAPGVWIDDGGNLADPFYINHQQRLHVLGDGAEEFTLPGESETEFRWRLRDAALSAAERSGVHTEPVVSMASEFGAPSPLLRVGGVVSSMNDISELPVGTVYYTGHPLHPRSMSVYVAGERGYSRTSVLGTRGRTNGEPVTIYSMPGFSAETTGPVADPKELAQIALRAWRLGKVYKRRNSWCTVFEDTLEALGITKSLLVKAGADYYGPGDIVTREQAIDLPEGALLYHHFERRGGFAVYVRDDSRTRNKSRTRKIWGYEDDGANSAPSMVVMRTPTEPLVLRISGNMLEQMPLGVTFTRNTDEVITLGRENRHELHGWVGYTLKSWPDNVR